MSRRLGEWIIGHRVTVLAGLGVVTLVFGIFAARISIDTNFSDLIPTRHPYMDVHRQFSEQLGGALTVFVMIEVKDGDIFNPETLEKVDFVQREIDAIPGVNHNQVISIASKKVKKVVLNEFSGLDIFPLIETVPKTEEELEILRIRDRRPARCEPSRRCRRPTRSAPRSGGSLPRSPDRRRGWRCPS